MSGRIPGNLELGIRCRFVLSTEFPLPQRELWHVQLAVNSRYQPYSPESGIGIRSRMPNVDRIPPELEAVQRDNAQATLESLRFPIASRLDLK